MNAASLDEPSWSRSQWIGILSLIVGLHLTGILVFSKRLAPSGPGRSKITSIHFVGEPIPGTRLAEVLALEDPLTFVRLTPQTFPGANSLTNSRFSHELSNRTQPYRWLAPADQHFADDFSHYVSDIVAPSTFSTERIFPALSEVPLSASVLPRQALLRVEGDLEDRRLVSSQPMPANESSAILTSTVVGVRVSSAGEINSTVLISSCGSPKADQSALAFARQARFERLAGANNGVGTPRNDVLSFGQLIFQWFPISTTTNQLSARP